MFCPNCGKKLPDEYVFCDGCGFAVNQPAQPQTPPAQEPAPVQTYAPAAEQEKPKSKAPFIILGSVVGGLALLLAILFLVLPMLGLNLFGSKPQAVIVEGPGGARPSIENTHISKDNIYADCYEAYPDYVLPESNTRYYSHQELLGMPLTYLTVARQELYSRYGVTPTDPDLQEYFKARAWFTPSSTAVTLNTYEEINLALLDVCIAQAQGTFTTSYNPYLVHLSGNDGILTYSSSQYLTADDLYYLNETELLLVRNEIFARHGYIFEDRQILDFFLCQDWYVPSVLAANFDETALNEYEDGNVGLIQVYERKAKGVTFSPGNPYSQYGYYYDYIFSYSDYYELESYDVSGMSIEALCLARNEIFARHGYTFTDEDLLEYFLQKDWYRPSTPPGRRDLISLTSIESKNVDFIKSYEDFLKSNGY